MSRKIRFLWGWRGNSPDNYTKKLDHVNNAQKAHHIYYGLKNRIDNVVWGMDGFVDSDILITTSGFGNVDFHPEKYQNTIIIVNHMLYNEIWNPEERSKFPKNVDFGSSKDILSPAMLNAKYYIITSNDVSISKYNSNSENTSAIREYIQKHKINLILTISPIDKKKFYREVFTPKKRKFLVLGGKSENKRQHLFRSMCDAHITFDNCKWFVPKTYTEKIKQCSYVAHISRSEAYSYFTHESMCKGLLPFAGEGWWDGYGHEILIWREGKIKENKEKIKDILNGKADSIYEEVISEFLNRTDNTWDVFNDKLLGCVKKLL